jgi:hypothetical protein
MKTVLEQLTLAQFDAKLDGEKVRVFLPKGRRLVISAISGMYMVADADGERTSIPCGSPEEVVDAVRAARG